MRLHFSSEQEDIQNWAKNFSQEVIAPQVPISEKEKLPTELLEELSQNGFMTLTIPEEEGGGGLDPISFSLVLTEIAKVCASTSISIAVTNMIAETIHRDGTEKQKKDFLAPLIEGHSLTASFCLTENASGSDAAAMQTKAQKDEGSYILNGEKIYVTNGAFSNFFLVMAKTSEEVKGAGSISAFLVERNQEGVTIGKEEEKMGLSASSTLRMAFENVQISEERRLLSEGEGFKIAMRALDGGRISVASQALGTAAKALDCGVHYSKEREQFGKTLSNFEGIQWKLADASTEWNAAQMLIYRAAALKAAGKKFTSEAAMAKLFTTEMAIRLCNEMIQVHGGYGYIKEYPVEKLYRDARVTALYEGTSEIQRLVIARSLLKA